MISVEWIEERVRFIDQTRLPADEVYVETSDYRVVGEAIKKLQIRGAPAIGVAAAFAVVLAVNNSRNTDPDEIRREFHSAITYLSQTRPTAVNLFAALRRMERTFGHVSVDQVVAARSRLLQEAKAIQKEDADACRKIGEYGATLIEPGSSILTHCNTGSLATAGEGTALSIITTAAKQNKIVRVFVDETRPLLQGARLTTWELMNRGIDCVLVTDSTAGLLMQQRQVDAIIVGADRIAANGDVANKIGTFPLAVLAEKHTIPFYVAAPTSTIDIGTPTGKEIPIEERDANEVTHIAGVQIAPDGVKVFAPAFDLTSNELITAIVTETGILKPPYQESIGEVKSLRVQASEHTT